MPPPSPIYAPSPRRVAGEPNGTAYPSESASET